MNCGATDIFAMQGGRRPPNVLLIGYGNGIRSDDGVGPMVVSTIASGLRESGRCECIVTPQLVPELVEPVRFADRVLFIDASVEVGAGKVRVREKTPGSGVPTSGHYLSPEALLAMARALWDCCPRAWAVEIGVASLAVGESLTPRVHGAGWRLSRHLLHRIESWIAQDKAAGAEHWRPRKSRGV